MSDAKLKSNNKKRPNALNKLKRRKSYRLSVILALLLLLVVVFFVSCSLGAYKVAIPQVFRAIFKEKDSVAHSIIYNVRVARNFVAVCVGICLALSGAILQGVMRNPLASPNIIGVSSGAGLGAMLVLIVAPHLNYLLTPVAFIGGLITTMLIYTLSWKNGINPFRMVLAGIAVSSLLGAFNNAILIFYSDRVQSALGFMVGSLASRTWVHFRMIWPYALFGLVLTFVGAGKLNILAHGDEMATGLGLRVELTRVVFIMLASLLAAASVSIVGILGFVGLIVPHIIRLIIGSDYRYLFPASALLGAIVVVLCDTVSRLIFLPIELHVGIAMSIIGVPFFLYLLRRSKLK
jgi:iron complex transport system permease protein